MNRKHPSKASDTSNPKESGKAIKPGQKNKRSQPIKTEQADERGQASRASPGASADSDRLKASVRETYSEIAEHFDATRYMPWPETIFFASTLKTGSTVADLGCGNGRNSLCLAEFGMQVVAVDFVRRMLDITERKARDAELADRIRTVCCDVTALDMPDASVDAALCIATIHHLPSQRDRELAASEIARVLKIGGKALVSVWAREQERFREELARPKPGLGEGDVLVPWTRQSDGKVFERYVHLFTRGELQQLFRGDCWRLLESFEHADNHYVVVERGINIK